MTGCTPAHPDPVIAAEIERDAREAEAADVVAGYPPRPWRCGCGTAHSRGHFLAIGRHRCLACGYVGEGGHLLEPEDHGCITLHARDAASGSES